MPIKNWTRSSPASNSWRSAMISGKSSPPSAGTISGRSAISAAGAATFLRLETRLQAPGKQPVDVMLSISKIVLSDKRGYIVVIKELGRPGELSGAPRPRLAEMKERPPGAAGIDCRHASASCCGLQQPAAQVMREAVVCPGDRDDPQRRRADGAARRRCPARPLRRRETRSASLPTATCGGAWSTPAISRSLP